MCPFPTYSRSHLTHLSLQLAIFDLRFIRQAIPIMVFRHHVNSVISRKPVRTPIFLLILCTHPSQGLALDLSHDVLFAAGSDCRLRAWSLRTGTILSPASSAPSTNPFKSVFSSPLVALQVTEDTDGTSLYAAADVVVHRYHLGQQPVVDYENENMQL
jgi:WD repeat-containing protein 21A